MKEAVNRALHGDLGTNFVHGSTCSRSSFSTEDAKEGLRAFTEKQRPPRYVGR